MSHLLRALISRNLKDFSCLTTLLCFSTASPAQLRKALDLTQSPRSRNEVHEISGLARRERENR
jgi:hypothetical protein